MEALNIEFVKEVEKYPELYDYTKPSYSRKDVVDKAWVAVGRTFNLSGQESKEKWRNLRNSFVKNLKPPVSGSGRKKKTYYLSEAMQFTLPFVKAQGVISGNVPEVPRPDSLVTFPPPPENQNDIDGPTLSDDLETPIATTPPSSPESHLPPAPRPTEPCTSSTSSSSASQPSRVPPRSVKRKRVATAIEDADKNIAAYFAAKKSYVEAKRNAADNIPQNSEAIKMFLLSLIPDLVALPRTEIRTFKRRTLDLIEDLSNAGTAEKIPPSSHSEPVIVSERSSQLLEEDAPSLINDTSEGQGHQYFTL